jgi:hypothetical protein
MARNTDMRKPTLPRVSTGLSNILAQSGVVAKALGSMAWFRADGTDVVGRTAPHPERVSRVPANFHALVGKHSDHPGEELRNGARQRLIVAA